MAVLTVLAGVNGAGKSSIAGALHREKGGDYFNPDEVTRSYRQSDPSLSNEDANARAWNDGKALLEAAIDEDRDVTFETTLGGRTIAGLLLKACKAGHRVRIFYMGLSSADLHIRRVRARVAAGGHDIPEERIRARYRTSRENLCRLVPFVAELAVYDNSAESDPKSGSPPRAERLLHLEAGRIMYLKTALAPHESWAKPVLAAAMEHALGIRARRSDTK